MTIGGDYYCLEDIKTHQGRMRVRPLFVDPVSDIAVLGALDNQVFPDEARKFERFCETTKAVRLANAPMRPGRSIEVRLLDADGSWVTGTAEKFEETEPSLWISAEKQVDGGASGGPVLNAAGELVAVISIASSMTEGESVGHCADPRWALPAWLVRKLYQ